MTNTVYRLKADYPGTVVDYRYEGKEATLRSLKGIKQDDASTFLLKTEAEVILHWAGVVRNALEGQHKESDLPCWEGHYEQFGAVMLHLAHMSRNRKFSNNFWNDFYDKVISANVYKLILDGRESSDDRIFYRAWLSLIGHPHYMTQSVLGMELLDFKHYELMMLAAHKSFEGTLTS